MAIAAVVPNSMWALAALWLMLCDAVSSERACGAVSSVPLKGRAGDGSLTVSTTIENCGHSKGGCSIIDNSMQCGSLVDVCLSVLAVLLPCGLALSAESWGFPGICFQTWNLDDGDSGLGGHFLGLMACGERWSLGSWPMISTFGCGMACTSARWPFMMDSARVLLEGFWA